MWRTRVDAADEKSLQWQSSIATLIRSSESKLPKKHLISQDYTNFAYPLASPDPQIDLYTFHYGHPKLIEQNYHWNKPIGINETGFSGMKAEPYRKQAWRFMCSGGSLFNNLDYSFSPGRENGLDTANIAPGHGSPAFRQSLRVLRNLLETGHPDGKISGQRWKPETLRPDQKSVRAAYGADVYGVSDGSNQWVMYLEGYQTMTLSLSLPKGVYEVSWFSVFDGKAIRVENISVGADAVQLEVPKGHPEIALKLLKSR
jgi:hypothetical protein